MEVQDFRTGKLTPLLSMRAAKKGLPNKLIQTSTSPNLGERICALLLSTATGQAMNAGPSEFIRKSTRLAKIPEIWEAVKL
jgi:hypothetical protein